MATNAYERHISVVQSLLQPSEIITKDSADYQHSIKTWAYQKQQSPPIVVRPTSVESLSRVVAYLYPTDLDLAIYGQGFMSTSAKDALIITSGFDAFHFDKQSETITIGAGQAWGDVYNKLGTVAPEYGGKQLSTAHCHLKAYSYLRLTVQKSWALVPQMWV